MLEKCYERGAFNKTKLDRSDTVCGMENTPTFWPLPGNGSSRQSGCAYWGPAGPFAAVSYCAVKLVVNRCSL